MKLARNDYYLLGGGLLGGWLVGWFFGKKQGAAHPAGQLQFTPRDVVTTGSSAPVGTMANQQAVQIGKPGYSKKR